MMLFIALGLLLDLAVAAGMIWHGRPLISRPRAHA